MQEREANNIFPFLIDYEYERHMIENPELKKGEKKDHTLLKKTYIHKMPTPMRDLLDILENPTAYEHYKFVISGTIQSFSSTSVASIVKKMDEQTKKM